MIPIPIEKLCRVTSPKGSSISQWYNTYIIARPQNDYLAEYMARQKFEKWMSRENLQLRPTEKNPRRRSNQIFIQGMTIDILFYAYYLLFHIDGGD